MDREHPIPQEVSTYEFRLVGDMTIKQFMQVAAGALIALILYSSNLAPYVKWPLILISFLAGVALAFFPIEDRPLSKWIVLFMKAIYSPTIYLWNKNARKYEFFQPETDPLLQVATGINPVSTTGNTAPTVNPIQMSPSTVPPNAENNNLEKNEQKFLDNVSVQFAAQSQPVVNSIDEGITPDNTMETETVVKPGEIKVEVPLVQAIQVETQEKIVTPPSAQGQTTTFGGQVTRMASQDYSQAKQATFSEEASPPSPPTRPNIIVGQVMSMDHKIIDGAILEIKDIDGRSVRALRSNRLGHFMIVTPLLNGQYRITTDKEGYSFDPVSFEAKDQIIPPIAIWAKQ